MNDKNNRIRNFNQLSPVFMANCSFSLYIDGRVVTIMRNIPTIRTFPIIFIFHFKMKFQTRNAQIVKYKMELVHNEVGTTLKCSILE